MTTALDKPIGARPPAPFAAALTVLIVAALLFDAALSLALEVLFLPLYRGSVPIPVTALLAGVVNVALVHGMTTVTSRPGFLAAPLVVWTLGFLVCASSGPGGDIMLGSDWRTLLLLFCGLIPPLVYLYVRVNARR
ncbi:hypothetical protein ACWEVD_29110 [Nocardia thailandica]|uniref:Integral membrane protein n=1 Tax=Nocardia thailandica TaxID=257275 RepID=A0ABW6PKD2_9NOCA|nr:hypothetical protein [Nocardia thailandica]